MRLAEIKIREASCKAAGHAALWGDCCFPLCPYRGAVRPANEPMPLRTELLEILVCPKDHSPLRLAGTDLIARLNHAIALGTLKNRAGQKIERRLGGGLVRGDQSLLYPIVDEIPMMLVDEAIPLDQDALAT